MPRALIADDEPHLALYLKDQLQMLWPALDVVHVARNGIEAAQQIAALEPDLAFLDIQMPGLSGLEVAQGIEGDTRVVFVTAFDEYAVQAFDHAALDYLLKPLRTERLTQAVVRIKAALAVQPVLDARLSDTLQQLLHPGAAQPRLRYVRAAQGQLTHQLTLDEIVYFYADDKYTVVLTAKGEHLIRTPIAELIEQLDPARFWQIHRSSIINLDHVAGTRRDDASRLFVRFKGVNAELPVSRAYVHLFRAM